MLHTTARSRILYGTYPEASARGVEVRAFYYTFIRRCVIRHEVATFLLYYLVIFGYRVCGSRFGGIHMRCVHMDRKGDRHGLQWLSTRFGSLACHSMLGYYSWRSRHSFLAFLAGEPLRIRIHVDVCS